MFGFGKKEIGQVPVPGEGTLAAALGQGRAPLRRGPRRPPASNDGARRGPGPKDLEVTVTGAELAIPSRSRSR